MAKTSYNQYIPLGYNKEVLKIVKVYTKSVHVIQAKQKWCISWYNIELYQTNRRFNSYNTQVRGCPNSELDSNSPFNTSIKLEGRSIILECFELGITSYRVL